MGCCLVLLLLAGAPRVALMLWWFVSPDRVVGMSFAAPGVVFSQLGAPLWIWPLLGLIFLPWTTIAFVFVAPGGVVGWEWLVVLLGFVLDLTTHGGGGRAYRRRRADS
jgi:hypothetical protein